MSQLHTSLGKRKSFISLAKHCEVSLLQFNPSHYDFHLSCPLFVIPVLGVFNCFRHFFCSRERRVILVLHLIHAARNSPRNMSGDTGVGEKKHCSDWACLIPVPMKIPSAINCCKDNFFIPGWKQQWVSFTRSLSGEKLSICCFVPMFKRKFSKC